jgi:hypothetical protein
MITVVWHISLTRRPGFRYEYRDTGILYNIRHSNLNIAAMVLFADVPSPRHWPARRPGLSLFLTGKWFQVDSDGKLDRGSWRDSGFGLVTRNEP